MNSAQLFSGRAYSFGSDVNIPTEEASYRFVEEVVSKSNLDIEIDSISEIDCNENYDSYKVVSGDFLYCVKISLDNDCEHIKKEIEFYKDNNESGLIPLYLDSGHARIGSDIIFLICTYENGYNISDDGLLSVIENSESFFYTLHHFGSLKTSSSFSDYLSVYLRNTKIKETSKILEQNVSINYELESIQNIFDLLYVEAKNASKLLTLTKTKCCHGSFDMGNIVTRGGLYKLKNFNYTFEGSLFFDISFFCVTSGLSKSKRLILLEKYCDYHDISLMESKNEFETCMQISSCLFFSRILFDYLIEETIFETRRPERLFSLCFNFSKCFHNLNNVKCRDLISDTLKTIITKPVIKS